MLATSSYVCEDGHGVLRVAQSRVMLDSIVVAFEQGHSPETIVQQFPSLSLEEVYGAITYYLAHSEEIAQYLQRQDEVWKRTREQAGQSASPVVQRLRKQSSQSQADAG